jgi:hypothetical protein
MGETPEHFPKTRFKIMYGPDCMDILFHVEDRYVKAVSSQYQGPVYQDSCVEFFFSPNERVDSGYFNLEINCCGTALFEFHPAGTSDVIKITKSEFEKISVVSSEKTLIHNETAEPLSWIVAFRIPWRILETYTDVTVPAPGISWRGNFHKCADMTSHPHWLTWAPIDFPSPRFHLPQFFGVLSFV